MTKIKAFAGVIAAAALLAGCSGGSDETGATEAQGETAAAPAAQTSSATPAADDISTVDGTVLASFTGNASAGKAAFAQCRTCHVMDAGVNKIGPTLNGIIGRKAGSVPGFAYSDANKNAGYAWSKEKLFQFLEKPQRVMPKTKMIYAGLSDAQKRADIIAYLENPA